VKAFKKFLSAMLGLVFAIAVVVTITVGDWLERD
jgi:hypothetical protein